MSRATALLLATTLTIAGCGASLNDVALRDARAVSDAAAMSLETAQAAAELLYKAEQLRAVDRAASKDDARAAVLAVRERWAPVKATFARARALHESLTRLIRAGAEVPAVVAKASELAAVQGELANAIRVARERLAE